MAVLYILYYILQIIAVYCDNDAKHIIMSFAHNTER